MNGPTWRVYDDDGDPEITGTPRPLLVTARSVGSAIRRTWRVWVGAALIGGLLGVAALFVVPRPATATTTLFMVHPDAGDPSAMTTDVSLLTTRVVASEVLADLDLTESPSEFLATVSAEPLNGQILLVTVTGPDDDAAVARATSLVDNFLQFRAKQLRSVADGLVQGYTKRVTGLEAEAEALTEEYARLGDEPSEELTTRASEIIASRAKIGTQITELQRSIESAGLQTDAAVTATHVIDSPAAKAQGSRRQVVLFGISGALLGAGVSIVTILFRSLTTNRVRRRREVASALGVPVRVGVGPVPRRGRVYRAESAVAARIARMFRGHPAAWTARRQNLNLQALVQGLGSALPPTLTETSPRPESTGGRRHTNHRSGPTTLGLAAIDRAGTAAVVLRSLGTRLASQGVRVLLVDLSYDGALVRALAERTAGDGAGPEPMQVFRPEGDPALVTGPRRAGRRPGPTSAEPGDLGELWAHADVVLALVEVHPGIDLGIVRTWVNRVVPLVTAGRASGELLTTIRGLAAASEIDMPFALLDGADRSDESFGVPDLRPDEAPSRLAEHR